MLKRLLYLVNSAPGFRPTTDQWEEVKRLVNQLALLVEQLKKANVELTALVEEAEGRDEQ